MEKIVYQDEDMKIVEVIKSDGTKEIQHRYKGR